MTRTPYGGGEAQAITGLFEGKRLNSPNDLVYKSDGSVYFTDPPFGLAGMSDSPLRETPFHGVYRLTPDGAVKALVGGRNYSESQFNRAIHFGSTTS